MKIIYPFSPIIWEKDKYLKPHIIPKESYEAFGNNIYLINFGALSQIYFSLFLFEFYKKNYPDKKLFFIGNPEYYELVRWQGLAKVVEEHNFTPDVLKRYPCPIFHDLDGNIFYNPLYQIKCFTDELGIPVKMNKSNLEITILNSLCIDNYNSYKTSFRLFPEPKDYDVSFDNWLNLNKYILQKDPVILFLPEKPNINYNYKYILTSLSTYKHVVVLKTDYSDLNSKFSIKYNLFRLIYLMINYKKIITNNFSLYWVFFCLQKQPHTYLKENIFPKKSATQFCEKFDIDKSQCNFVNYFQYQDCINFYR